MAKVKVLLNEQHSLLKEQEQILNEKFGDSWEILSVPSKGWSIKEMDEIIRKEFSYWEVAVFASPIPYLIKRLSFRCGAQHVDFIEGLDLRLNAGQVFIFHNDKREKKELPNGKVIFTVAKTGWKLV